ncbi:MAG: general secretion pathway protein GspK, partial [Caldiserica bacterium]|nr:general secretion pathway protein GspK [Caldisericota bacterium]
AVNWVYNSKDPYGTEIDAAHPDTPFLTPYYYTSSSDQASWAWGLKDRLSPDTAVYDLYILGLKDAPLEVSVSTWNQDFQGTNWVYRVPGADGIAYYGEVVIGDSDTEHALSDTYIQVMVRKPASYTGTTYFDGIVLAPLPRIYGKINVNTADTEVLHALPGLNDANLVDYIVSGRPYHNIGEVWDRLRSYTSAPINGSIVTASQYFSRISNLITVRGKLFRIEVTARYIRDTNGNGHYDEGQDEVLGEYSISTIYER